MRIYDENILGSMKLVLCSKVYKQNEKNNIINSKRFIMWDKESERMFGGYSKMSHRDDSFKFKGLEIILTYLAVLDSIL